MAKSIYHHIDISSHNRRFGWSPSNELLGSRWEPGKTYRTLKRRDVPVIYSAADNPDGRSSLMGMYLEPGTVFRFIKQYSEEEAFEKEKKYYEYIIPTLADDERTDMEKKLFELLHAPKRTYADEGEEKLAKGHYKRIHEMGEILVEDEAGLPLYTFGILMYTLLDNTEEITKESDGSYTATPVKTVNSAFMDSPTTDALTKEEYTWEADTYYEILDIPVQIIYSDNTLAATNGRNMVGQVLNPGTVFKFVRTYTWDEAPEDWRMNFDHSQTNDYDLAEILLVDKQDNTLFRFGVFCEDLLENTEELME